MLVLISGMVIVLVILTSMIVFSLIWWLMFSGWRR